MALVIDVTKAKVISHDLRRTARDNEMAPLDAIIMKQIPGASADEAEAELRQALSMNANSCHTDWDLAIDIEKEIAKLLVSKGRVSESEEILRRIANLEEIMSDEE